jgi:hypothetical protein
MKTMIFMLVVVLQALTASAQKNGTAEVPQPVLQAFKKMYPLVKNAKWEKEKSGYEACFKQDSKEQSVVFNANGQVLETEVEITYEELPQNMRTYLEQHYKRLQVKETAKITDAKGVVTYEAEVKGWDLLFDAGGKLLKEDHEEGDDD